MYNLTSLQVTQNKKAFQSGFILLVILYVLCFGLAPDVQAQVSISGTVYEADGVTPVGSGKTVTAAIATSTVSLHSATTNGSGEYTISGLATSTGATSWTARTAAARAWQSVTYGNGIFVAVACGSATSCNGTVAARIMTSPDGITWTDRSAAGDNDNWRSVAYGNGMFVAVSGGGVERVITSPDGINWTARPAAGDNDTWISVTYGNGRFVAVSSNGDRAMYSDDGVHWTVSATPPAARAWATVTYGNGLFVALACGSATTCNVTVAQRLATSPDGNIWTMGDVAGNNDTWQGVTYGGGQFVAVGINGDRIMTSPNGTTWTVQTFTPAMALSEVVYANGQYVALACGINTTCNITATSTRQYTSRDGVTWVASSLTGDNDQWQDLIYAKGIFVALSINGDRVITSDAGFGDSTGITIYVEGDPAIEASTFFGIASTSSSVTDVDLVDGRVRMQHADNGTLDFDQGYFIDGNDSFAFFQIGTYDIQLWQTVDDTATFRSDIEIAANTKVRLKPRLELRDDITNNGTITDGTIRLMGTSTQTATGTGSYRNLRIDNTSGDGVTTQSVTFGAPLTVSGMFTMMASTSAEFLANSTSTIGTLDLFGMEEKPVWLRSSSDGTKTNFAVTTTRARQYANVKDIHVADHLILSESTDAGNNSNVLFGEGVEYIQGTVYTDATKSDTIKTGVVATGYAAEDGTGGVEWGVQSSDRAGWNDVTYGNGLFVAVSGSDLMTSPNGIDWTPRSALGLSGLTSVTYGNGLFVAVLSFSTESMIYSTDGITWATSSGAIAGGDDWDAVTYGNGTFVAVSGGNYGINRVMTSSDGINWTVRSAAGDDDVWTSVTYGNDRFVAVGTFGDRVMYSSDGITWATTSAAGNNDSWSAVHYAEGLFVAAGFSGDNRFMTSPDGITWTARSVAGNDDGWNGITYGNGLFVAVGTSGDRVMYSLDGITWATTSAAGNDDSWSDTVYGNNLFVAVANCSSAGDCVMTSSHIGATKQNTITNVFGEYVQPVSSNGGRSWNSYATAGNDDAWRAVTYGNGLFVAVSCGSGTVCNSTVSDRVMYSTDGVNWSTTTAAENDDQWSGVAYGNGLFVAVASAGDDRVMISSDGINWAVQSAAGNNDTWTDIVFGDGIFVAVSCGGPGCGFAGDRVMISSDGINWAVQSAADNDDSWQGITYGNGLFVAVGISGDRVMTSPDGEVWTARSIGANNIAWKSVAYGNGIYVAIACGSSNFCSTTASDRAAISTDGVTWTIQPVLSNNHVWQDIVFARGVFVAVTFAEPVVTSLDGITWTSRTATGALNVWLSIAYGGETLVAVGRSDNRVMTASAGAASTTLTTVFLDDDPSSRKAGALIGSRGETELDLIPGEFTIHHRGGDNVTNFATDSFFSAIDDASAPFAHTPAYAAIGSLATPINLTIATNTTLVASDQLELYGDLTRVNSATFDANNGTTTFKGPDPVVHSEFTGTSAFHDVVVDPTSQGQRWVVKSGTAFEHSWGSITYGEGLFVAVAGFGSVPVMTSPDGITWTARSAAGDDDAWTSVTYGNGRFVAVGSAAFGRQAVMYSNDGITWATTTAAGDNDHWLDVTYGNGLFVAVSCGPNGCGVSAADRVMTSPDGITWTVRSAAGNNDQWTGVTYGNGLFVAVGNSGDRVMTSPDGTTWTVRTAAEINSWSSVTYGNGLFVAVARSGTNRVMTSLDGITWTARSAAGNNDDWLDVTYANNTFVAVGSGPDRVMTSPDGITWTVQISEEQSDEDDRWSSVTFGEGVFVAVNSPGDRVLVSNGFLTLVSSTISNLRTATTSSTQINGDSSLTQELFNQGILENNARITFSGNSNVAMLGVDAASLELGTVVVTGHATFTTPSTVTDFTIDPGGSVSASSSFTVTGDFTQNGVIDFSNTELLLAGTTTQTISGSLTGANSINKIISVTTPHIEVRSAAGDNDNWESVIYGNNTFVAVGGFTGDRVMYSTDGITWATTTAAGDDDLWRDVVYGNGTFVAVADSSFSNNTIMYSTDGITWSTATAAGDNDRWLAITYGNNTFVAVSRLGDRVMYSTDGITWATTTAAGDDDIWRDVTYGNNTFVAVASVGGNDRVMYSTDGITWATTTAAGDNDSWRGVTYGNGLFVAVSFEGDRVMTSPDGITWTVRDAAGNNDDWIEVTYGNGLFVAVSDEGPDPIMTSPDGITWTVRDAAGNDDGWYSVAYGNTKFVVVGYLNDRVLTIEDSGVTKNIPNNFDVETLILQTFATLSVGTSTVNVSGTYTNNGTFNAASSTVVFSGTDPQIASGKLDGTSAFYNLTIDNQAGNGTTTQSVTFNAPLAVSNTFTMTASSSAAFTSGATTTLENISLEGTEASPVWLRSTATGTDWYLDVPGDQLFIQYVNVQDSTASSTITAFNSFDAGNNENWNFNEGGDSVSIAGTLYEADGVTPVAGATIKVAVATSTPSIHTATTNSVGNFLVTGIATGTMATSTWSSATGWQSRAWQKVAYGNGRFVAVGCGDGAGNSVCNTTSGVRVITSTNGESWTIGSMGNGDNDEWRSVTYGGGQFVAVAANGDHRIATSPDGITWTTYTAPEDSAWVDVAYGNGRYVAVACSDAPITSSAYAQATCSTNSGVRVMYSDDGITWATTTAAGNDDAWRSVSYGNGVFVAVGGDGDRVMTSFDGISWTVQDVLGNNDSWRSVTFGNGIFMAVSTADAPGAVSSDGVTWTLISDPFNSGTRSSVTEVAYGNGAWVVVSCRVSGSGGACSSGGGGRVSFSYDNGQTWQPFDGLSSAFFFGASYGNGRFIAMAQTGVIYNRTPFLDSTPITIYVDNNTRKAAAISYIGTSTSAVSGISLRDGTVTLDHALAGGVIDLSDADFYDADNDTDIPFTANTATTTIGTTTRPANLTVTSGTTLMAPQNLELYGDFTQGGGFRGEKGDAYLIGTTTQTMSGSLKTQNAFHNLTITNTSGTGSTSQSVILADGTDTTGVFTMRASTSVQFDAGSTYTFNDVNFTGTESSPVWLRSSASGTSWYIDVPGTQVNVDYVNVQDSVATTTIYAASSTDAGNNENWNFNGAFTGTTTLATHDAGQVSNAFNFQNKTNQVLFAFKLIPESGTATTTNLALSLTGVEFVNQADFSNINLYRDNNNDGLYDELDIGVGGVGTMSIAGTQGTITFTDDFALNSATNFLVIADFTAPQNGSFMSINLLPQNITIIDENGTQDIFGSVERVQHNRNNRGGGASSPAQDIGGAPPAGDPPQTGGGGGGGQQIGDDPNFRRPTSFSGVDWSNPANAYDQTNGTYSTNTGFISGDNDFSGIGYSIPGNNQIVGIEVRFEAVSVDPGGTVTVQLVSGGLPLGNSKTSPGLLEATDTVVTLGGPADTWGRNWTPQEISTLALRLSATSGGFFTDVLIDEIQVRVYFQSTGGGGGGGGDI